MSVAWSGAINANTTPPAVGAWRKLIGSESRIAARGSELAAVLHIPQSPVRAGMEGSPAGSVAHTPRRPQRLMRDLAGGRSVQIGDGNRGRC